MLVTENVRQDVMLLGDHAKLINILKAHLILMSANQHAETKQLALAFQSQITIGAEFMEIFLTSMLIAGQILTLGRMIVGTLPNSHLDTKALK